jgi:hypothetical protein
MNNQKAFSEADFLLFMEENLEQIKYLYINLPYKNNIDFSKFANFVYRCS